MNKDFWLSRKSLCLLNSRFSDEDIEKFDQAISPYKTNNWIWLKSSGTESALGGEKLVALSYESILNAAEAVVSFFQVTPRDHWLNPLPLYHVGGLSISARCFVSQCEYSKLQDWVPKSFVSFIEDNEVTISSMVPTQIYDLVKAELKAPATLRFVLVGGGNLSSSLYKKARALGWPLLPSYGMTETCALIASANLDSLKESSLPKMQLLPHVKLYTQQKGFAIESSSLYQGFLFVGPDKNCWVSRPRPFILDDHIELEGQYLKVLGRESELIKILGETVNIALLEEKICQLLEVPCAIVTTPEPRRGYELKLYIEAEKYENINDKLNDVLMPYEGFSEIIYKPVFPRTELGKIIKNKLL